MKIPRRNGFATENMDTSEISGDIPIPRDDLEQCRSINLIHLRNGKTEVPRGSICFADPYGNKVGKEEVK